jgi:hypothetical protein
MLWVISLHEPLTLSSLPLPSLSPQLAYRGGYGEHKLGEWLIIAVDAVDTRRTQVNAIDAQPFKASGTCLLAVFG